MYTYLVIVFISIQELASESGCHQMLWLFGEDRQITEVGAMNVFIFYKTKSGGNIKIHAQQIIIFKPRLIN